MSEETGRLLARWAKRKSEAKRQSEAARQPQVDKERALGGELGTDATDEEVQANLPEIDSLDAGSDYKPFMEQGVPVDLKNQALKKLWASNPLYNHIDMLDDYCEDYTDAACAMPGVKTAYKIGRGFVDEITKDDDVAQDDDAAQDDDVAQDDGAAQQIDQAATRDGAPEALAPPDDDGMAVPAGDDGGDERAAHPQLSALDSSGNPTN